MMAVADEAIIVMFGSGWFMVQASFRKISEHHRDVRQFAVGESFSTFDADDVAK